MGLSCRAMSFNYLSFLVDDEFREIPLYGTETEKNAVNIGKGTVFSHNVGGNVQT